MSTHQPISPPDGSHAHELRQSIERVEEDPSLAVAGASDVLQAIRVAAVAFIGLLVCPPLAVLVFVFVVPMLVVACAIGLVAAVLWTPYLLVQHLHGRGGGHLSLLGHRLRHAARSIVDLAPHRIAADVRKLHSER